MAGNSVKKGGAGRTPDGGAGGISSVTAGPGLAVVGASQVVTDFDALPTEAVLPVGSSVIASTPTNPNGAIVPLTGIKVATLVDEDSVTDDVFLGETIAIIGDPSKLTTAKLVAPNTFQVSMDTTGAVLGQIPTVDTLGNIVWADPVAAGFDNGLSVGGDGNAELGGTLHQDTLIDQTTFNLTTTGTLSDGRVNEIHSGSNVIGAGTLGVGFTSTKDNQLSYFYGGDATAAASYSYQAGFGVVGDAGVGGGNAQAIAIFNGTTHSVTNSAQDGNTSAEVSVDGVGVVNIRAVDGNLGVTAYETYSAASISSGFNGTEYEALYPTGNKQFVAYPETRDDTGATPQTNVLYTDALGNLLSAPYSPSTVAVDNGLSIGADTKVELGGVLHKTTEIITDGFDLNFNTAANTDTSIKDNGDVVVGKELIVKGDGGTNNAFAIIRLNPDGQEITNAALFQKSALNTASGNGVAINELLESDASPFGGYMGGRDWIYRKSGGATVDNTVVRAWQWLTSGIIRVLIASSKNGLYFFGNTGFDSGVANPAELPVTSTSSTLENLAIDTSNGQIVRGNVALADKVYYQDISTLSCAALSASTSSSTDCVGSYTSSNITYTLPNIAAPTTAAPSGYKWVVDLDFSASIAVRTHTTDQFLQGYFLVNGMAQSITSPSSYYQAGVDTQYWRNNIGLGFDINQASATSCSFVIVMIRRSGTAGTVSIPNAAFKYAIRLAKI